MSRQWVGQGACSQCLRPRGGARKESHSASFDRVGLIVIACSHSLPSYYFQSATLVRQTVLSRMAISPSFHRYSLFSSFVFLLDLKAGCTILTLFNLFNKSAGVFGLLAIFQGGTLAQLTLYAYSLGTIFISLWGLRGISEVSMEHASSRTRPAAQRTAALISRIPHHLVPAGVSPYCPLVCPHVLGRPSRLISVVILLLPGRLPLHRAQRPAACE